MHAGDQEVHRRHRQGFQEGRQGRAGGTAGALGARARGCNPMCQRLQPHVPEAATTCARGCNHSRRSRRTSSRLSRPRRRRRARRRSRRAQARSSTSRRICWCAAQGESEGGRWWGARVVVATARGEGEGAPLRELLVVWLPNLTQPRVLEHEDGAAWDARGCSLGCMGLQPGMHGAAAWGAQSCSLGCTSLQVCESKKTVQHVETFTPNVIEPSFGIDRILSAMRCRT